MEDLYDFKNYYFLNHSIEYAVNIYSDVKKKLEDTLVELKSIEGIYEKKNYLLNIFLFYQLI